MAWICDKRKRWANKTHAYLPACPGPTILQQAWATTMVSALLDRCRTTIIAAFRSSSSHGRVVLTCAGTGRSHRPKSIQISSIHRTEQNFGSCPLARKFFVSCHPKPAESHHSKRGDFFFGLNHVQPPHTSYWPPGALAGARILGDFFALAL